MISKKERKAEWKKSLPSYYGNKINVSQAGIRYKNLTTYKLGYSIAYNPTPMTFVGGR